GVGPGAPGGTPGLPRAGARSGPRPRARFRARADGRVGAHRVDRDLPLRRGPDAPAALGVHGGRAPVRFGRGHGADLDAHLAGTAGRGRACRRGGTLGGVASLDDAPAGRRRASAAHRARADVGGRAGVHHGPFGMRGLLPLALVAAAAVSCARADAQTAERTAGAAWRVVEWPGGAVVAESDAARLQNPVQPGSILKLPALIAALNAGIATPGTRVPCRGEARVGGHVVRCSHPRQRHALGPSEALALSCNVWFATIGSRLPRARFDAVLTALGLPPSPGDAPMPLAVTGLRATSVPPLALLEALRRIVTGDSGVRMTDAARRIVMDGLP